MVLDLWHLVAGNQAESMKVPRHKLVMAAQTRMNLQGVAQGVVTICASKDAAWDPWIEPHGLSEVKIEHRFGQLRSQFAGGEMTARGYFSATARLMRQMGRASDRREKDSFYTCIIVHVMPYVHFSEMKNSQKLIL